MKIKTITVEEADLLWYAGCDLWFKFKGDGEWTPDETERIPEYAPSIEGENVEAWGMCDEED